ILHLVQLFFEEEVQVKLQYIADLDKGRHGKDAELEPLENASTNEPELYFKAMLEHQDQQMVATVELTTRDNQQETFIYRKAYASNLSPRDIRRLEKQSVAHALVKVLEHWTGIKQPWGILTGVRPTKLMHRFRREGRTEAEIREHFEEHLLLQPEKNKLLQEIVERQVQVVPDFDQINQEVSIYIGIPFCPTKCAYCTFPAYAINRKGNVVEQFLQGLELEIKEIGAWLNQQERRITTLYFG